MDKGKQERRYDVDWLRVAGTLAIFLFHCSRFFDTEGWALTNADQSLVLELVRGALIWPWVMELFFLLSGVGSWFALRRRTGGQYLWERVKRLVLPLYTVGLLALLPSQFYFHLVTNEDFGGTFWEAMRIYIGRLGRFTLAWPGGLLPVPYVGHLWFLQFLFLISLVTLPLLLTLRSDRGRRAIEWLAGLCARPGGVFIFVIPLALAQIVLRFLFPGDPSWADLVYYAIFFLIGYLVPADPRFTEGFVRHRWVCLALWLLSVSGQGVFIALIGYQMGAEPFSLNYVLYQIVVSVLSWSAVVCMLSLGAKRLNFAHKRLPEANEAVLPFYLLHQTIILCVGWFVIRWPLGILPKYLIIAVISFPLILLLYELLVRRFGAVRFFFGMRPLTRESKKNPSNASAT